MKVRISYVVDLDDDIRREINTWYGRPGLASRAEVKRWYESNGTSMDPDLGDLAFRRAQRAAGEVNDDDEEEDDEP